MILTYVKVKTQWISFYIIYFSNKIIAISESFISGDGRTMNIVPHINQLTRSQTLPVHHEMTYDIVIVSMKGMMDMLLISVADDEPITVVEFCFGSSDTFGVVVGLNSPSIRQDVTPISGR